MRTFLMQESFWNKNEEEIILSAKDLAKWFDGINYLDIMAYDFSKVKENGLVVIYGQSDDLIEFEGGIYDEGSCFNGGEMFFNESGLVSKDTENANKILACWNKHKDYSWTYELDIPHESFDIYDDGKKFCRGIVFQVSDIK